ncbi:RNA-binding domain-containing protein [Aaosphaeria arxii CBS 175.79]|uniref:RNA-binding domain-containing protein n=1 Tax=Aaosphaeria arxii CBS 175.79 TaxID=1450172 RepID=A0A6A5XS44_9PLEO|nr:RNA-binding domain-containing protein [Aaosphaeria arxii CBS 175.79]KAF2015729.1 RNA-binding domain-containing protein [Aaosphaeria arxii CBS 175.79]
MAAKSQAQPVKENQTIYCNNLPDQIPKDDLKRNLYMLFATYGVILDIIALKTPQMRGQAHIVFRDIDSSTQAMRALNGFNFFGKEMRIQYAKSKSDTIAKLDGTFKIPVKEEPAKPVEQPSTAHEAVFGSAAPAKAKPMNAPEDSTKGVKRGRDEESEDEDDDAAMDVSDSD